MAGRGKYHELLMATTAKAVNAIMEADVLSDLELRTEAKRWGQGQHCLTLTWALPASLPAPACTCRSDLRDASSAQYARSSGVSSPWHALLSTHHPDSSSGNSCQL
jgi:hypothetical protein